MAHGRAPGRDEPAALGGYRIEALLGVGATGAVYRARQLASGGRLVALKRLRAPGDPSLAERIRREGAVLAALDHPHVVRVFELLADGDGIAIAMQYAPGGSLADLLARRGRLGPAVVVAVAAPIADALASAHRRGLLHRDVKPANILFTSDGEPLLSDFGVARWVTAGPLTAAEAVGPGTAGYLDPAVADGTPPDARSDLYALGVVCYEALTGARPFEGPTPLAVLRAADQGAFTPLRQLVPEVPPALAVVVERALARDPARRFPDAAVLAAALRAACPPTPAAPALVPQPVLDPQPALVAHGAVPPPSADAAVPSADPAVPPSSADAAVPGPLTWDFGPRPPRPPPAAASRRVPKAAVALVALALVSLPVALASGLGERAASATVTRHLAPLLPPAAAKPRLDCPPTSAPPSGPGTRVLTGDLDGDGCPSTALWRGNVLEVGSGPGAQPRRYELGRAGDLPLLGDWDCDGADTPGLYRPETGEVFLFDGWAADGQPLRSRPAHDSGTIGGQPRVAQRGGCDDVEVVPVAGRSSSLAAPTAAR